MRICEDSMKIPLELQGEDFIRDKFGKENYLRSASIPSHPLLILTELLNGEYLLWEAY